MGVPLSVTGTRRETRSAVPIPTQDSALREELSSFAHDFNHLLTAILVHCDGLQSMEPAFERQVSTPKLLRLIEGIRSSVEHATGLVQQLAETNDDCEERLRPTFWQDAVRTAIGAIASSSSGKVRFEMRLPASLMPVRLPSTDAQRILRNLFWNAREAMGGEGVITIRGKNLSARAPTQACATLHAERSSSFVQLSVSDTGNGLTQSRFKEILAEARPPIASKPSMGLRIVRAILEKNSGRFRMRDRPGKGATFEIIVPAFSMPDRSGKTATGKERRVFQSKTNTLRSN